VCASPLGADKPATRTAPISTFNTLPRGNDATHSASPDL
jgi:hypothetical protein